MKSKNDAMKLASYYHDWIAECTIYKSANTILSYRESVNHYMNFLEKRKSLSCSMFCTNEALTDKVIKEWLAYMCNECYIKPQSCNVRLAAVRAFLRYLASRDAQYRSLYMSAKDIPLVRTVKKVIQCMSRKAVKTVLATPDVKTKNGYRDVILMSLAYCIGARIDEELSIKLADLNLEAKDPYVLVKGKGNKHRALYINKLMTANLKKYIRKFHGNVPEASRFLFYTNTKGPYEKISQEAIRKKLKLYAVKAHQICEEVPLDLHMHHFRHAMALHRLEDGMNIVQLSKEMGHENIQTTMIYLDVELGMKEKAIINSQCENIRKMPKRWKADGNSLTDLFK